MSILLPNVGVTYPYKAEALLDHASEQIVGTFLVPGGYGFDEHSTPNGWTDAVLKYSGDPTEKDESSSAILEMIVNREVGSEGHDSQDGIYLMFWIGILASPLSPCDISFCIQHIRLFELQMLLGLQIKNDISTHTETLSFSWFQEHYRPDLPKDLDNWKVTDWEHYCHQNFAEHGHEMYERWLAKTEKYRTL